LRQPRVSCRDTRALTVSLLIDSAAGAIRRKRCFEATEVFPNGFKLPGPGTLVTRHGVVTRHSTPSKVGMMATEAAHLVDNIVNHGHAIGVADGRYYRHIRHFITNISWNNVDKNTLGCESFQRAWVDNAFTPA